MNVKPRWLLGLVVGLGFASWAHADGTSVAQVGVTSNYIFRGVSESDGNPALQGKVGYEWQNGFYADVFGSTVDIPDSDAVVEAYTYGGYKHPLPSGATIDLGAIAYTFLGGAGLNFYEAYAGVSYGSL